MEISRFVSAVPAKIPRLAVYLTELVKADLERLAYLERRSLSQMGAILIEEGLKRAKTEGRFAQAEEEPVNNEDA